MIYLLLLLDREKSIGAELYNQEIFSFDSDLLISLVQSILILADEIGDTKPKGDFRELEIGQHQIGVIERGRLAYIFVHNTYDNEPFTKQIVDAIIDEFHEQFLQENLNYGVRNIKKVRKRIEEMLTTMQFPKDMEEKADEIIHALLGQIPTIDTIFLADLDDGIVKLWASGGEKIVELLLSILSEIPFERSWIGETKLYRPKEVNGVKRSIEAWIIQRIGFTDFCILVRCIFNSDERDRVITAVEVASRQLQTEIFSNLEKNGAHVGNM